MKPITPERRAEIQQLVALLDDDAFKYTKGAFLEVLDAEEYWRTTVANADIYDCCFCGADGLHLRARAEKHKPDCPWLLATAEIR